MNSKIWNYARLSDIAQINPKELTKSSEDLTDLEVSFIPMRNVEEETGLIDPSIKKRYSEVKKGFTRFLNSDILFAKITPCMENGKIAIADNLSNGIGIGSTEFHVIRLLKDFSNRFYFYYLMRTEFRKMARKHMKGTAGQQRVPINYLENVLVPVPPLKEQQKIASILSNVDNLIQKTDQVIEQTQRLKKGLMQRLLTKGIGHSKFKTTELGEIPEDWKLVRMKDVVMSYKNGIYKKSSFHGRGVLNIRMFNIQNGKINTQQTPLIDVTPEEISDYALRMEDILLNRVNSADLVGKAGILDLNIGDAVFDSMIIRIRVNESCKSQFLNYFLNSESYFNQIEGKIKHAIGQSSLNQDDLNSLLLGLPPIKEQQKIISILSIIDDLVQKLKDKRKKEDILKKGLMQQLLTGKIRVKV
jgi:type I restriction enzyme S subunit